MQAENEQNIEEIPALPLNFTDPNSFIYRKYNKQTKLLVEGTDEASDSTDKIFATTKVALPDGDLNWVFREDIQMWKGYTAEQLDDYLVEIYVPTPTATDEWQIAMIQQNASLVQQNRALTQTTANLTVRVTKLEKEQMEGTNNG